MKPVLLKIRGLNSFKEEQTIDFKTLMKKGFFGIFGPTGSGKSTILDAVTLVLYGSIPRNSTEFINSELDEANVYLEFELNFNSSKQLYVVQRNYKRKKDGGYSCKAAKIYNKKTQQILAEGAVSVTKTVEELLGLKADDFTRTVVLPQGKFSEFLTLKSKDRNDMLERILHLEDYGKNLTEKIKKNRYNIINDIEKLDNRLQVYSEVTQENLDSFKLKYRHLEAEIKETEKEKKILQEKYKEGQEVWDLQEEGKKYLAEQENLLNNKQANELKKNKVKLAYKAQYVKEYIQKAENTRKKLKEIQDLFEAKELEYKNITAQEESENNKYMSAKQTKEVRGQLLLKSEEKLIQALQIKDKIKDLEKEKEELSNQYKIKRAELKKAEKLQEETVNKINAKKEELTSIEEKKNKLKTSSEYKQTLKIALQAENEYELSQKTISQTDIKISDFLKDLKAAQLKNQQLEIKINDLDNEIDKINQALIQIQGGNPEKEETLLQIQNRYNQAVLTYNEEKHKQEIEALKTQLNAQNLKEGEPCPICGSIHHPAITEGKSEKSGDISNIEKLKEGFESLKKQFDLKKCKADKWSKLKTETEKQLEEKRNLRNELKNENIKLSENIKQLCQSKKTLEAEKQEIADKQAAMYESIKKYRQSLKTEDLKSRQKEIDNAEDEYSQLEKTEAALREELNREEVERELKKEKISSLTIEINDITNKGKEKKNIIQKYTEDIEQLAEEKNADIEERLSQVKKEITAINEEEKNLYELLQKVLLQKQKAEGEYIKLKENKRTYSDMLLEQEKELKNKLSENEFEDEKSAKEAVLSKEDLESMEEEINFYENRLNELKTNISSVELKLNNRNIEQEKLIQLKRKFENIENDLENLKNEFVLTKEKVSKMERDIEIVSQIVLEKGKLTKKLDLIEIIANMTKGNKFIKFVSQRQMKYLTKEASRYLKMITNERYSIELDDNDDFVMRDDFNAGIRRSPETLSGGELFNTSLALALALSSQIQLKNKAPLEFFFLDEGFGSLDSDLLDTVMNTLENLRSDKINIGVISHVESLKGRISSKLLVTPLVQGVHGSVVKLDV